MSVDSQAVSVLATVESFKWMQLPCFSNLKSKWQRWSEKVDKLKLFAHPSARIHLKLSYESAYRMSNSKLFSTFELSDTSSISILNSSMSSRSSEIRTPGWKLDTSFVLCTPDINRMSASMPRILSAAMVLDKSRDTTWWWMCGDWFDANSTRRMAVWHLITDSSIQAAINAFCTCGSDTSANGGHWRLSFTSDDISSRMYSSRLWHHECVAAISAMINKMLVAPLRMRSTTLVIVLNISFPAKFMGQNFCWLINAVTKRSSSILDWNGDDGRMRLWIERLLATDVSVW